MKSRGKPVSSPSKNWRIPLALSGVMGVLLICVVITVLGVSAALLVTRNTQAPENGLLRSLSLFKSDLSPEKAVLQSVHGLVQVNQAEGAWEQAGQGTAIESGDRIRTGTLSSVDLAFYDGSVAHLGPDSDVSVDTLEARKRGGPRRIELTQWAGESEHDVAKVKTKDSTYQVHTPNGTGEAKGTLFHILVTPEQYTRFTVEEGLVAVSAMEVSVDVLAGEMSTVYADQPPADPVLWITGQGEVSFAGETWVIAGQMLGTHEGTVVIGNPQVGDLAFFEGHMLDDETRVADLIVLLRRSPSNQFTLTGVVEGMEDSVWTVNGQTIVLSETTQVDEGIAADDTVFVEGFILQDGTLQAERIRLMEASLGLPFDFTGVAQTTGGELWTVSGIEIMVDESTIIDEELAAGALVQVQGWIQEDGTWLAGSIARALDEGRSFEFSGPLDSIDPWQVAGLGFETRDWTEIDEGLSLGEQVRVKGLINADGVWVAYEIHRLEQTHIVLVGNVFSMDPWVVSGITLNVDEETLIAEGITLGMLVRVDILPLQDGSWKIISIEPLQGYIWDMGCQFITATVINVDGNQIQLENWPTLTMDEDVEIAGELSAHSVVQIQICFNEDMSVSIVYIIVIVQPEEIGTLEMDTGAKVLVCHKPDKKGGHTLSISRSALPAHLGHGDYEGACR
jgi:hypothetical protein